MTTTLTRSTESTGDAPAPRGRRNRVITAAVGAVVVAAAAAGIVVAVTDGDDDPAAALELSGGSDALASCLPFSVDILADMPTAFEGTVTAVDGPIVTLDIDRWYHDGTGSGADVAMVHAPQGMEALIGGVAFEPGAPYLLTADQSGNVSYCGYSAPATDDLRAAFAQAFGG